MVILVIRDEKIAGGSGRRQFQRLESEKDICETKNFNVSGRQCILQQVQQFQITGTLVCCESGGDFVEGNNMLLHAFFKR